MPSHEHLHFTYYSILRFCFPTKMEKALAFSMVALNEIVRNFKQVAPALQTPLPVWLTLLPASIAQPELCSLPFR